MRLNHNKSINTIELEITGSFVVRLDYLPWLHRDYLTGRWNLSIDTPHLKGIFHYGLSMYDFNCIMAHLTLLRFEIAWWSGDKNGRA